MRSNNETTFIEQLRRDQIVTATIEELAHRGYVNTSFASIGERIGVSKSLIAYHFKSKKALMQSVVRAISTDRMRAIDDALYGIDNPNDQLEAMLRGDITHMCAHSERFRALTEISFHSYSDSGVLQFLQDDELLVFDRLKTILAHMYNQDGYIHCMAVMIDGARDSFLARYSHGDRTVQPEKYADILIATITSNDKER